MLGKFSDRIPANTVLRVYPVSTPPKGKDEYAIMEARGTLAGIYRDNTASPVPHPYKL